jgi:hypothetical protein
MEECPGGLVWNSHPLDNRVRILVGPQVRNV